MANGGYRGELGAAHVRIAQLEGLLEERRGSDTSLVKKLEADHARISQAAPRRANIAGLALAGIMLALGAPLVVIEARYEGASEVLIAIFFVLALALGSGAVVRWLKGIQTRSMLAAITRQVEEARRVQRLEEEVADLTARAAAVDVPKVRIDGERSSPTEPAEEEELEPAAKSRSGSA